MDVSPKNGSLLPVPASHLLLSFKPFLSPCPDGSNQFCFRQNPFCSKTSWSCPGEFLTLTIYNLYLLLLNLRSCYTDPAPTSRESALETLFRFGVGFRNCYLSLPLSSTQTSVLVALEDKHLSLPVPSGAFKSEFWVPGFNVRAPTQNIPFSCSLNSTSFLF